MGSCVCCDSHFGPTSQGWGGNSICLLTMTGAVCHVHVCSTHKCMHEGEEIDSVCGKLAQLYDACYT